MTDIKTLNDNLRKSFIGGRVILTQGINAKRYCKDFSKSQEF